MQVLNKHVRSTSAPGIFKVHACISVKLKTIVLSSKPGKDGCYTAWLKLFVETVSLWQYFYLGVTNKLL